MTPLLIWLRLGRFVAILHFWWQGQTLTLTNPNFFLVSSRWWLLAFLRVLELGVQVCVDAQRLRLLVVLYFRRALSLLRSLLLTHANKRGPVIIRPAHDISPRWEHTLNLSVLTINHLVATLWLMHGGRSLTWEVLACRSLLGGRLIELPVCSTTPDTLASSTKEAFHTVEIVNILWSLLLLRLVAVLGVVIFLMATTLVLQIITTVVTESGLCIALSIRLHRLHLTFKCVIYTLSLVHGVVHILGTRDWLHCEVWT